MEKAEDLYYKCLNNEFVNFMQNADNQQYPLITWVIMCELKKQELGKDEE